MTNIKSNNWDKLSLSDKSEIIKVAISNGITTLPEIKEAYNKFAEGGSEDGDTQVDLLTTDYNIEPTTYKGIASNGNLIVRDNTGKYKEALLTTMFPELTVTSEGGFFSDKDKIEAITADKNRMLEQVKRMYPNGIYGDSSAVRKQVLDTDTDLANYIKTTADIYNIDESSIRYRLAKEGVLDEYIRDVNETLSHNDALYTHGVGNTFLYNTDPTIIGSGFAQYGLDDVNSLIYEGKVKPINNESYVDMEAINEKGRTVYSVSGKTHADNIGLTAATLRYFKDKARELYPNAPEKELDRYANIFYNRGIAGGQSYISKDNSGYNINKFEDGGPEDNIFESDKVLGRANKVYTNYDEATDFNMNPIWYNLRNFAYQNELPHSGLSNCTLTATQWIDPNNPIKSASTIVSDPLANGYTKIGKEDIVPGNLMISRNPKTGSFHTMLIESINPDGTPNLRYSTGGPDNDSLRYNISQKEYHKRDNSQGGNHTEDMFFRYNYPNEYWLPGITVTAPKKHSLGGNLYAYGDWKPSKEAINRLYGYEGISMTQSYKDPLSGKWVGPNNSVDNEAKAFVSAIPESIRYKVLANPELADYLFSYSYNVGAGNFRGRVVPVLERYYNGESTVDDITNSMWASGDKKLKGLQKRRAEERQGVRNALLANNNSINNPLSSSPLYDESIFSYKAPVIDETMFASTPKVEEVVYDPMQEQRENLQRFASVMAMMNNGEEDSPYLNALNMASNPLMTIANINS